MQRYLAMLRREAHPPSWMGASSVKEDAADSSSIEKHNENITSSTLDDYENQGEDENHSRYWQVIATGTGLFSDGYLNNSIGFVTQFLSIIYGDSSFDKNVAMSNIGGLGYAGAIVGMLTFGFLSDHIGRKTGLIVCTLMLIIFSVLAAGSWGLGMPTNPAGMFAALSVWRVFLGVGIGGEYPCGSAACTEASSRFKAGSRHRWVIWTTCSALDTGFFVSSIVAFVLLYICGVPSAGSDHGMQTAWRLQLGLGAVPSFILLLMRVKLQESRDFRSNSMRRGKQPYGMIIKHWGGSIGLVSLIWFIYDALSYSWGLITPFILSALATTDDGKSDIRKSFAWTILFNFFYLPGTFLGGVSADWLGPRLTLTICLVLQGIVGFITAAYFPSLRSSVGAFVVVYGIFTALGEAGPGDNTILIASKAVPTPIRGRGYGFAAAMGKAGALAGSYAFPAIARRYGGVDSDTGISVLFYISSSLCLFSAVISLLLPELTQQSAAEQDAKFRNLLSDEGYDVNSVLGKQVSSFFS